MKNLSKIIDWKNAKTGIARAFNGGYTVKWHNHKHQTLYTRFQFKERFYGKPRYEVI